MKEERTYEMTEINRITNRHKARILKNLEDAGCPVIFKDAVASGINWLRSDLNDNERNGVTCNETKAPEANGNR